MSVSDEARPLSDDSTAIMLLCASLGKLSGGAPTPLSVGEYAALVDALRAMSLRPGRLLDANPALLNSLIEHLAGNRRTKITGERLGRLLERGGLLALSLTRWSSAGIWIVTRADKSYPSRYKRKLGAAAPPIIYGAGAQDLMERGGLAVVGSRKPDPESEGYTRHVGRWAASAGVQIVSGAARGVDEISMLSCADAGGSAVGVVADSLLRTSTQREFRNAVLKRHIVLLSSYDPEAGFTVGNAMGRNRWVYALADHALVVACSEGRGGTWAGALEALKQRLRVYVKTGNPARPGNDALLAHGALSAPEDLKEILLEPSPVESSRVNPPSPAYSLMAPLILRTIQNPLTVEDLSRVLGLLTIQAATWLHQLVAEGRAKKQDAKFLAVFPKEQQAPLFESAPEEARIPGGASCDRGAELEPGGETRTAADSGRSAVCLPGRGW